MAEAPTVERSEVDGVEVNHLLTIRDRGSIVASQVVQNGTAIPGFGKIRLAGNDSISRVRFRSRPQPKIGAIEIAW